MFVTKLFNYNMTREWLEWQLTIWQETIYSTSLPSCRTVTLLGGKIGNSAVASVFPLLSCSTTGMRSLSPPASCVRGSSSSCDTVGLLSHSGWLAPDCNSIAIWVTWTCWGRTISSRKKPSSSCLYLQQVNWFILFNHPILDWKQFLLLMMERVWFLLNWK
jgi:hypothetical protein